MFPSENALLTESPVEFRDLHSIFKLRALHYLNYGQYKTRAADYGLHTGYETRTGYKTWTIYLFIYYNSQRFPITVNVHEKD